MKKIMVMAACTIMFIIVRPILLFSQHSLEGVVSYDSSGTLHALPEATVFIPELNKGVTTSGDGSYHLNHLPNGRFTIQFSSVGFDSYSSVITISGSSVILNITLVPSFIEGDEITIYGTIMGKTSQNISSVSQEKMREDGSFNISDAVAKLPGLTQQTFGIGISKPVIRGLSGNRVQTVLLGMRFDNQQWQNEHGLGLSDIGVDRVEIIKGPASLTYGPEAIGGIIRIVEEKPVAVNEKKWDASTRFFTNNYGNSSDIGYRSANESRHFRIRLGIDSHADYSDGSNVRVRNSRYDGYYLKSTLGFTKEKFNSVNNIISSLNRFGFINADNFSKLPTDERLARSMAGPYHMVFLNVFTSQNTFYREKSKINLIGGLSSNLRDENEGGNKISLSMLLNTFSINAQWIRPIGKYFELTLGSQDYIQSNRNHGSRIIIPDANWISLSGYSYLKYYKAKLLLEGGTRYDFTSIKTLPTGTLNTAGADIGPFLKNYNSANISVGVSYEFIPRWFLKSNVSSGFRAPNLSELSSNGLHEGTFRWEIGDPDLKTEQNLNSEIGIFKEGKHLTMNVSVYYNVFKNFIYLNPTGINYLGFDVYNFVQHNATIRGGEFYFDYNPVPFEWLQLIGSYTLVDARTSSGEYLPIIPANKLTGEVKINFRKSKKNSSPFIKGGSQYYFAKDHTGPFETPVGEYILFYAGSGTTLEYKNGDRLTISIMCNNLLDRKYVDYLSMLRYYGIYNPGRNINLNFKYQF